MNGKPIPKELVERVNALNADSGEAWPAARVAEANGAEANGAEVGGELSLTISQPLRLDDRSYSLVEWSQKNGEASISRKVGVLSFRPDGTDAKDARIDLLLGSSSVEPAGKQ